MDYRQPMGTNLSEDEQHRVDVLRRRFIDPDEKKQFRNAYCFKAGYDFSTLKPFCEDVVMVTDGYGDHFDKIRAKLEIGLMGYDSDLDLIVPAGRTVDHFLIGLILAPKILQKPKARQSYAIAVYMDYSYKFYQLYLDPTIESHEIRTI